MTIEFRDSLGFVHKQFLVKEAEGKTKDKMCEIRRALNETYSLIIDIIPVSRERSIALTKLEEASLWASHALMMTENV